VKQGARNATILASLAFANMIAYAARNELFSTYEDLRKRFHFADDKLGALATAFILPHALATLLFGWAGDRWDRRRVIAVGLIVGSVGGAAGMFATDTLTLAISRAAIGFGTAAVVPVANSILGQIYDGPRKASRMAIFNLGLLIGGVVGLAAGVVFGFPNVVVALAIPGVAIALVMFVLPVPKQPGRDASSSFSQISAGVFTNAKRLLKISTLRWMIISASAMAFAAGGYNAWLIDFLQRDKGMPKEAATRLLSVAFTGALAGVATGATLADRLRKKTPAGRLFVIVAGMTLMLPAAIASIELPPGAALYVAGWFTLFFMSWYHAPIAVSVDDLAPPALSAAAQGLVIFTMHLVGTAPSSWILGVVSKRWSLYTAMWVPTVAIVIAALAMLVATRTFSTDVGKRGEAARASL
jgi:MFS transporter, Spinster family, sphingosine-1-phosphate transporter